MGAQHQHSTETRTVLPTLWCDVSPTARLALRLHILIVPSTSSSLRYAYYRLCEGNERASGDETNPSFAYSDSFPDCNLETSHNVRNSGFLGTPGPHIASEIGPGEPKISSDMWTRGPDFTRDMGTSQRFGDPYIKLEAFIEHLPRAPRPSGYDPSGVGVTALID